jgi:hypothetical protein
MQGWRYLEAGRTALRGRRNRWAVVMGDSHDTGYHTNNGLVNGLLYGTRVRMERSNWEFEFETARRWTF